MIMMTSAEYCHREDGHCIDEIAPGYGGCSDDVHPLFDKWCSGSQECNVDTSDSELKNIHINCPKFILKFTRVHHTCIAGNRNKTKFGLIVLLLEISFAICSIMQAKISALMIIVIFC